MLLKNNINVVSYLMKQIGARKNVKVLELGPGKGYFYRACAELEGGGAKISYAAFDRNKDILNNLVKMGLDKKRIYWGESPDFKAVKREKYDMIYSAYMIEHLNNGGELYTMIKELKKLLNPGGMIVFLAPDAMKQKQEFWNIDYTHSYPTTRRNVSMAFYDNDIYDVNVIDLTGIFYFKYFYSKVLYRLFRMFIFFYNYRLMAAICKPVYRRPLHRLDNIFYRIYCYFKEENLMFICRVGRNG
ncbi:class I SAM-dependent methyltransferase [Candidatus Saccharibacteria bacterium]|nr:class I SAM-dependent methyltransferase [Candidatus Saccharibacteria bacterium]